MHYFFIVCGVLMHTLSGSQQDTSSALDIRIQATEHEKLKMVMGVMSQNIPQEVITKLQHDLMFSGQFDVQVRACSGVTAVHDITCYATQGFPFALFINKTSDGTAFEWRMYDTSYAQMIGGKKYICRGTIARDWAHHIADAVWPLLTSQDGFFSTKLAFCKQQRAHKGHHYNHIYVADYDGTHARPLVTTPTVNVAPCWNRDSNNPILFYSENTKTNVRLMMSTLTGKRRVAANRDGITMLPAFSRDGTRVVYCASEGTGFCQLYMYQEGKLKRISDGIGNAISPSLSDDGRIVYYCSDKTGCAHIYKVNLDTAMHEQITQGSSCYNPSYSSKRAAVVYTKMIQGYAQLFVYDEISGEHTQLTFDKGHKSECSWSVCGNYVVFGLQEGLSQRIALLNVMTNEQTLLTAAQDRCTYPALSGIYQQVG